MKSVFYSPNDNPSGIGKLLPADINLPLTSWSSGDCSPEKAPDVPDTVDTLAGWSVGRLGPVYFLSAATSKQVGNIHRIVLFDPGASDDIGAPSIASQLGRTLKGESVTLPCDTSYDINGLLAGWLKSNNSNRLIVLTGKISEMKDSHGNPKYKALWKSYFAGIWRQSFANQATVCDYNDMSHTDVLQKMAAVVNSSQDQCPADPTGTHPLTSWNP